jgi:hypothetical protein
LCSQITNQKKENMTDPNTKPTKTASFVYGYEEDFVANSERTTESSDSSVNDLEDYYNWFMTEEFEDVEITSTPNDDAASAQDNLRKAESAKRWKLFNSVAENEELLEEDQLEHGPNNDAPPSLSSKVDFEMRKLFTIWERPAFREEDQLAHEEDQLAHGRSKCGVLLLLLLVLGTAVAAGVGIVASGSDGTMNPSTSPTPAPSSLLSAPLPAPLKPPSLDVVTTSPPTSWPSATSSRPSSAPNPAPSPLPSLSPSVAPSSLLGRFKESLPYYSRYALQDADSPQSLALAWLGGDDDRLGEYSNAKKLQRYALATFYFATGGPDSNNPVDDYSIDECDWYNTQPFSGLGCDDSGSYEDLGVNSNGLVGTLPNELSILSDLKILRIRSNPGLTGAIPERYGSLLTNLQTLDLSSNGLSGPIPSELGLLTKLTDLNLEKNTALTGGIPSSLGSLTQLRFLRLSNTRLTGVVPAEICNLVEHHALEEIQVNCRLVKCNCGCVCG